MTVTIDQLVVRGLLYEMLDDAIAGAFPVLMPEEPEPVDQARYAKLMGFGLEEELRNSADGHAARARILVEVRCVSSVAASHPVDGSGLSLGFTAQRVVNALQFKTKLQGSGEHRIDLDEASTGEADGDPPTQLVLVRGQAWRLSGGTFQELPAG